MKNFFDSVWSGIKKGTSRTFSFIGKHKIISAIILIVIVGGAYWGYTAFIAGTNGTEYVLSTATKGPLQVTVTSSGQVAANEQLALSPQASGQITEINVTTGEAVKAGDVIAEVDPTTADEAVQSAQEDLQSAQISYQQTLTSSQTSITSDQTSINTDITNTYSNLPAVMTGLDGILHNLSTVTGYTAEENIDAYANYVNSSEAGSDRMEVMQAYSAAVASYQETLALYNATNGQTLTIAQSEQLAQSTLTTTNDISEALTDTLTYYNYINDEVSSARLPVPSQLSTEISSLNSYESTVSGDTSSLTTAENSLENDSQTSNQAPSSETLTQQSAELNVQKAQEALAQAQQNLSNYVVTAPFDGTIASVAVKPYDQASSGTTVATLITSGEYADLSLNEADVANVKVGQPATMTFDALPNATMTGTVAQVSDVGTVSSGVVTYDVQIAFSSDNSAIKPGMTVEATIITASSTNAIQVPSAAVHTTGNYSYVEVATLKNASSTLAAAGASTGARRTRTASSTGAYAGFSGSAEFTGSTSSLARNLGSTTSSTTVSLTTASISRSLTVPASDVTIKNVPVTLGLSNSTMTQILTGVTAGEYIVTATQSATTATTKTTAASATSLLGGTGATAGRAAGGYTGGGGGYTGGGTGGARGG